MRQVRWENGKFLWADGRTFVPFGGVFSNAIFPERCGLVVEESRRRPHWRQVLDLQNATGDELRTWLRHLKSESINYVRYFAIAARRLSGDPLDIGGRVHPVMWEQTRRYMDIAAEEGIFFHFNVVQEPRTTVYMNREILVQRALPHYSAGEIARLPKHQRRWLDPDAPRVEYDTFFTDPDVMACHKDYITELAGLLKDHPALLCLEVYNEQQWPEQAWRGSNFMWSCHDQEVAWTAQIVRHMREAFAGVPVCCSFAGFGIAAQDPLLWIDRIPMDFFSPHAYQQLAGTHPRLDFAGMCDVVLKYSQGELPTMMGEFDPSDFKKVTGTENLTVRDMAWFSVLNNCPGFGMWTNPGFGEFEIPAKVMAEIDFGHFRPKAPAVVVNIKPHVDWFHSLEKGAGSECRLPGDFWCPHRPGDADHIYCKKYTSRELAELHDWEYFALNSGINYAFTRFPERFGSTWNIRDIGKDKLERIGRPFVPSKGVQLKYMSSADDRTHVVYLRHYTYLKVDFSAGRMKGAPREVQVGVKLPGGEYDVEIWNLDARTKSVRTCQAEETIGLGTTSDDFALVFRARE